MGCMKWFGATFFVLFAVGLGIVWYKLEEVPETPEVPDLYWGPGESKADDTAIKPFKINFPAAEYEDLIRRLNNTRELQPPLEGVGFNYGMNTDFFKGIINFWKTEYNWKERQEYLNSFPQFTTQVSGLNIHYIHVKPKTVSAGKEVLPLLLLHGWPGSVREFYDLIPYLVNERADEKFVFEVIAPSLPGYGFSQGASKPGLGPAQVSIIMKKLMERIGFKKFYIQGGDWGSLIGRDLALLFPEKVLGYHSNFCTQLESVKNRIRTSIAIFALPSLYAEEGHSERLASQFAFLLEESGYMHLQATKPDTVGVGLTDSPAGLAAYILEKFSTWTSPTWKNKPDGGLGFWDKKALLDNVMMYWISNSITTSVRLYSEAFSRKNMALRLDEIPVTVPAGCARFPNELMYIPKVFLRSAFTQLVRLTDMPKGGHFAAFEVPQLLAEDVWQFVSAARAAKKEN